MNNNSYPNRISLKFLLVPVVIVAAIVTTLIGLALYFHSLSSSSTYGPPYYGWGFGWPFFGFGWIFIPIVFIVLFFGFHWFFWGRWGSGRKWGYYRGIYDSALQTLRERYARGEITKEQFSEMERKLLDN